MAALMLSTDRMAIDLNGVSKTDYAALLQKAETRYQPDVYYFSVDDDSDIYVYDGDGDVNTGYDVNIMRRIVEYSAFAHVPRKNYEDFVKRLFILQIKYLIFLGFWENKVKSKNIRWKLLTTLGESLGRKLNYGDKKFIMKVNNIRHYEDAAEHYLFPRGIIYLYDVYDINYKDENFLLTFANHDRAILKKISESGIKPSRKLVLECVKHYGFELVNADKYKTDSEIVRMAVLGPPEFEDNARVRGREFDFGKSYGVPIALQFASDDIKNNREFIFEVFMEFERRYFRYLPPKIESSRKRKRNTEFARSKKRLYEMTRSMKDLSVEKSDGRSKKQMGNNVDKVTRSMKALSVEKSDGRSKKTEKSEMVYVVPTLNSISKFAVKNMDYDLLKTYSTGEAVDERTVNEDFLQYVWETTYYSHRKSDWQEGTYRDFLRDMMLERLMILNSVPEIKLRF